MISLSSTSSNFIDITASGRTESDVSSIACGEGPFLNGLVKGMVSPILFYRCPIVNIVATASKNAVRII
jgi:hypothetical protein